MVNVKPPGGKVRYAVVGAGWFGQAAVLPAFANAGENSVLAAIVSGDPQKRAVLGEEYGVPCHPYEEYDALLASGAIDAVFVVSPNSEHKPHTIAAANRGVHVLCEKPLADTAANAEEMVEACDKNRVLLMTAYRLHFEKSNLTAVRMAANGTVGDPRMVIASNLQSVEAGNSRLNADLGGHPLLDVGIYCVNAARYLFRDEPTEVTAFAGRRPNDPRFAEVHEAVTALMRFPGDKLAAVTCGFGHGKVSACRLVGTTGEVRLEPGFSFEGERKMYLSIGEKEPTVTTFPSQDQVAPEIVYFSNCILTGDVPEPDGLEGLADLRIMEAMLRAAETGQAQKLTHTPRKRRPDFAQAIDKPAVEEKELVHAAPPG